MVPGYLDDAVIVPLGLLLAVRLMPADLLAEFRAEAARRDARPRSRADAAAVITLWVAAVALLLWWLRPHLAG